MILVGLRGTPSALDRPFFFVPKDVSVLFAVLWVVLVPSIAFVPFVVFGALVSFRRNPSSTFRVLTVAFVPRSSASPLTPSSPLPSLSHHSLSPRWCSSPLVASAPDGFVSSMAFAPFCCIRLPCRAYPRHYLYPPRRFLPLHCHRRLFLPVSSSLLCLACLARCASLINLIVVENSSLRFRCLGLSPLISTHCFPAVGVVAAAVVRTENEKIYNQRLCCLMAPI